MSNFMSIIIHLEVININVRNFNFPIGFYSNPHPLWTPLEPLKKKEEEEETEQKQ